MGKSLIVKVLGKKEESHPPFDKSKLSFLQFATRTRDWIVSIYEINRKHWYHPGWNDSVSLAGMFRPEVHWLKGSYLLA